MFNITKKQKNSGFAMLYASLIGSLVLAIGLAILNVTIKQITLASAGRESQHAFYSADTGVECALYLERGGGNDACGDGVFGNPDRLSYCTTDPDGQAFKYTCAGQNVNLIGVPVSTTDGVVSTFSVTDGQSGENICFNVSVTKKTGENPVIESHGYNTCDTNSTNRFERAIESY